MRKKNLIVSATSIQIFFLFLGVTLKAQISGKVVDSDGLPIVSASIVIENQSNTITDFDGNFTLPTPNSFPVILEIYQSGYVSKELELFTESQELVIYLQRGQNLDEVIVTAGRRPEKIQDAPNSVSVILGREIASKPLHNPVLYLEKLAGIDLNRQSGGRVNINLRGPAGLLITDTYVMQDYRGIVQAGLNVFDQNATALIALDLERVEVVRGPVSSLYGPGVSSGVVHFLSKDPFRYPGTEIELVGGNLDTYRTQLRHAGTNNKKNFGYKINVGYQQNGEWDLPIQRGLTDPNDEIEIDNYKQYTNSIRADGSLYFKLKNNFNITAVGGFTNLKANFWSDRGPVYQEDADDVFFQARAQNDHFFFQFVYNSNINNPDKKGYLYFTGEEAVIDINQTEIQIQYNNQLSFMNTEYTLGVERRSSQFDSPVIFGRNDVNDDLTITGAYFQTKSEVIPKLELVLSGRTDHYGYSDEVSFSPNAALVFKPNLKHTFRGSFSQTYVTPGAIDLYTDFPFIRQQELDLWLYGGKNPINIPVNPEIQFLEPLIPNQTGLGVNHATVVGIFHQQFGLPNAGLNGLTPWQAVDGGVAQFAQSLGINPSLLPSFSGHMQDPQLLAELSGREITKGITIGIDGQPLEPRSTQEAKLRSEVNFEVGWKGIIGDKVQLSLDVFNLTGRDFSVIRQVTPLVAFPNLRTDLRESIEEGGGLNSTIREHILRYVQGVYGSLRVPLTGLPAGIVGPNPIPSADQVVQLLWTSAVRPLYQGAAQGLEQLVYGPNGDQNVAGVLGVVRSDKNPDREKPVVMYSYTDSNIDKVTYTGVDFGSQIALTQDISAYANYSWVSQNIWRGKELGPKATESDFFGLNKPQHRLRLGFNYNPTDGFNFGVGTLYSSKFESLLSPLYNGEVDSRVIVNANVGYGLENISLSLNVDNLFGTEYSLFPRMPIIGRRVLATVRYRF